MAIDIENPGADEAELRAAIRNLSGGLDRITISADTTLDSSHYGKLIVVDTAGVDLTLPAAPATDEFIKVLALNTTITVNGEALTNGSSVVYFALDSDWHKDESGGGGGGSSDHPGYKSGRWYAFQDFSTATVGLASADRVWFFPFMVPYDVELSELGMHVSTPASSTFMCGIYANDDSENIPTGTALTQTAKLSSAATGTISGDVTNITLLAGQLYWFGYWGNNAGVFFRAIGVSAAAKRTGAKTAAEAAYAGGGTFFYNGAAGAYDAASAMPDVTSLTYAGNGYNSVAPAGGVFRTA